MIPEKGKRLAAICIGLICATIPVAMIIYVRQDLPADALEKIVDSFLVFCGIAIGGYHFAQSFTDSKKKQNEGGAG